MDNTFASLIQSLSAAVQTKLEIQDAGKVHVNFDDNALLIEYLPDAEQILLVVPVADVPLSGREELYKALLCGQYVFSGTRGATLAVDQDESFVCLQMAPSVRALTQDNFPVLVENFLNMADHWRRRCREAMEQGGAKEEQAKAAETSEPGLEGFMLRV